MDLNGNPLELPPAYKFRPSDQELLVIYLRRKAISLPLSYDNIPEIPDVFYCPPWGLPSTPPNDNEYRFFYSPRTRNSSCIVNTGSGYWKRNVDEDGRIVAPGTNSIIGIKKSWVYYSEENVETQWTMHQFSLVRAFDKVLTEKKVLEVGKWNAYRIYKKKEERDDADSVASSSSSESSDDESSNSGESSDDPDQEESCNSNDPDQEESCNSNDPDQEADSGEINS